MVLLRKSDRIDNLYSALKESKSKRLRGITHEEAREIINTYDSLLFDFFVDSHHHGFDGVSLGEAGNMRITSRKPTKFKDVQTGEEKISSHTPLYYFKPSAKLKKAGTKALNDRIKYEEDGGFFWNG